MQKKIQIRTVEQTTAETFKGYILSCKARGLSEKTTETYCNHFHSMQKYINTDVPVETIRRADIDLMISEMRKNNLAPNSIKSYMRTLRAFFSWCSLEDMKVIKIPSYKAPEALKSTYTDGELELLLKKPNLRKCRFSEYRNWMIINVLLNNGCRASSIRNIKNEDVDITNKLIYLRHTKNHKVQAIPLCDMLCKSLIEYMNIRGGSKDDYLFPDQYGGHFTENGLRCAIKRYNVKRGVSKTSIHQFRHTFAKKYLVDCGGNAFNLQKLLGHSTLEMTKHYCAIFDSDVAKNYDSYSPLVQMKSKNKSISMRN